MVERVVIQTNTTGFAQAEAYVEHVCDHFGIMEEFGIVSSAVLAAISAISSLSDDARLNIEMGDCEGGIYCQIESDHPITQELMSVDIPNEGDKIGESAFAVQNFADVVTLSDDAHVLRMEFFLDGVESPFARQRQQVLKKYFASHVVEA